MKLFSEFLNELRMYDPDNPETMNSYPFEDNESNKQDIINKLERYIFPELSAHGYNVRKYDYNDGQDNIHIHATRLKSSDRSYSRDFEFDINKKSVYLLINTNREKFEFVQKLIASKFPKELVESYLREQDEPVKKFDSRDIVELVQKATQQWKSEFVSGKFGLEKDSPELARIFLEYVLSDIGFLDRVTVKKLVASENYESNVWTGFPKTISNGMISKISNYIISNWKNNLE